MARSIWKWSKFTERERNKIVSILLKQNWRFLKKISSRNFNQNCQTEAHVFVDIVKLGHWSVTCKLGHTCFAISMSTYTYIIIPAKF